ncbi:MAG TPA: hypothetical protein V6D18_06750 [Thermosynechococcaceae cyanobacterium]
MTADEIEAILKAAFSQCAEVGCCLSDRQKQILLHALCERLSVTTEADVNLLNPLDRLTGEERQALLAFVQQQESQQISWKVSLLNDWLQGQDSGSVQFVRQKYGLQWLDQVKPIHLDRYADLVGEVLRLKVGDRIEVTNGLWEWVQDDGPCSREWFACTVVGVTAAQESIEMGCVIRFDSGAEYEIQGIYDWNRPNWRWLQAG